MGVVEEVQQETVWILEGYAGLKDSLTDIILRSLRAL
jgi:hypothetical protein